MRQFYSQIYKAHYLNKSAADMLKAWLIIYYQIEPHQQQKAGLPERISQLRLLLALTDIELVSEEGLSPYSDGLKDLVADVHPFLRGSLIRQLERCYGSDSEIVKFECELYVQELGRVAFNADCGRLRDNGEYLPARRTEELKRVFLKCINQLLNYFGIDALQEAELFR
jgi:hypothetical protein